MTISSGGGNNSNINTTTSNSTGNTYIKGDESTNNSIRIIDDNGTPVFQKRENGVWNDSDLRVSGDSLHIGRDLSISAAGHHMVVSSKSGSGKFLLIPAPFSDSGTNEPEMPILNVKETRIITQSDDTNEVIGTSFGYIVIPSESQIISRLYYQTGSIPASADIVLRAYFGTDNTGVMYLQKVIPVSEWITNTEIQIDIPGFLNYIDGVSIYGELTSTESFSIKTNLAQDQPWRAADRWVMTHERISYAPAWSEKTWNKDEWCINNGKIYVCNQTGSQTGSFVANNIKWDLLSDLIAKVLNYKGAISVADFNALTEGAIGDQYKLSDSGTLVGSVAVNANDTVIIKTNFTSLITENDYDHFAESSDIVLQTGRSGGQQISGGIESGENLVLKSTEDIIKGKIIADDDLEPSQTNTKSLGSLLKVFLNIFSRKIESDDALELSAGGTDKNITLTATGIGTIIPASDIAPSTTNSRSLGSLLKVFKEIFTRKITSDDTLTIMSASNKAINITSGSAGAINISSEGTGAINIGTDAHAKPVTIGNNTNTTAVNIISGLGNVNITGTGNVGINTSDLDGTPAVGKVTIKGTTNDGTSNIIVCRDSDETNVFTVDTDGVVSTPKIAPLSNSTTGFQITKADKNTVIVNIDTTNTKTTFNLDAIDNAEVKVSSSGSSNMKFINVGTSGITLQGTDQSGNQTHNLRSYGANYFRNAVGIGKEATAKLDVQGTTTDGSTNIINLFDSAGVSVFKVDTDGKIGIGPNSPLDALDINPGTAETWQRIYGTTNAGIRFIGDENSDWNMYKSGGGSFRIAQTPDGGTTLINRLELDTASYSALRSPDGIGFIAVYNTETSSKNTIRPSTNNTYDLGTSSYKWKDGYFVGSVITPMISSFADGSSGILITKADKTTPIMTFNTTLGHIGIGGAANTVSTLFVNNPDHTRAAYFETDQSAGASAGATGSAHFTSNNGTGDFNNYGIRIATTTQGAGNAYGIMIDTDTGASTGSKYGIYVAGATSNNYFAGNVGVGIATPNASAILDLTSTTKGFVCPRMTIAQRDAISSPTTGLEVYVTDGSSGKYAYNGTGWDKISNLAYLKASNVVSVNPAANTLLNFSSGVISNGIKTNHNNGSYTLYPGVYELMGVQLLNENDAGISYQFYNYTTSSYIGEKGNAADVVGSAGTGSPAFAILVCTVDTQIGLRCSNDSATVTSTEGNWLKIKQIS